MRQIIRRRRQANTAKHDEDGSLYALAEAYLDAEHEMLAAAPSQDAVLRHKISQVLQQRFNYNPIQPFTMNHGPDSNIAVEPQEGSTSPKSRKLHTNKVTDEGNGDCSDLPGDNNEHNATTSGNASEDGTEHRDTEKITHPNDPKHTITDLKNMALRNGTILKIDLSSVTAADANQGMEDVFDALGSLRLNQEMLRLWTDQKAMDVVYFNDSILPILSTSAEEEYFHIRNKAALINKSYALPIMVTGKDASDFMEHFATCSLRSMKRGMVQYTALVDTKGSVMDMAYVAAYENSYLLVTNGLQKRNLFDYMSAYQMSCKRSGMDVALRPLLSSVLISFQGPSSVDILQAIAKNDSENATQQTDEDVFEQQGQSNYAETQDGCTIKVPSTLPPFMRCFECELTLPCTDKAAPMPNKTYPIHCLRVSDVGEDGFEMLVSSDVAVPLLSAVILNITGITDRRVGLIANERVDTNCNILNGDTRKPIGFVTSCSWSYGLKMYLAQAYVNAEYARHDMPVLLSLPLKPEAPVTKREFRKYYRNKTRRTIIRGTVVRLPFVLHNYPISASEKHYVGGRHVPLQTLKKQPASKANGEARPMPGHTSDRSPPSYDTALVAENRVGTTGSSDSPAALTETSQQPARLKTRKQLWKEVVNKQRSKNAKTLEMALTQVEKATVGACVDQPLDGETCTEQMPLPTQRINITPRAAVPLEKTVEYYRELHSKPVPARHRRYRPPMAAG
ncbi:glycine cleavage T-protein (aminomethyl transferase) domain containing protein, putative [Babesia bigemina]|uniref:Glycine cleavage T-protein (Aminomethyl transferase) domain containing protein, putative n=1 Tax=Babesia bigemina TaxID=5866 RepID=A0A061DCL5_BABBI|nr:glycine cleavage T-protein (aminomethyl transferase) domain containing protein, putative [Babesia bigemina]CDR95640.1 glycine cleavage T-protein (aminomethyl transferase) domain containing protein, putative [Babesia bigemina]|eukprot:XP_012767826.1 glycine cleavage T-protein (aminomethyl transferase) domain containing protein, putative [Babesia bigemina]